MKRNQKKYWILIMLMLLLFFIDRKFFLGKNNLLYDYNNSLLWMTKPNLNSNINSKGFADFEHDFQKPLNKTRIVIIGDSFMVTIINNSLENTYPRLLEQMLNHDKSSYEVINLGVSGYGTDQELLMLNKTGLQYDPDIVILGLYLENDIPDNSKRIFEVSNNLLVENQRIDFMINKFLFRTQMSVAGRSISYTVFKKYGMSMTHMLIISGIYSHIPYYGWRVFENVKLKHLDDDIYKTKLLLQEFQLTCEQNNISLYVVLIPSILEIDNGIQVNSFSKPKSLDLNGTKNKITNFLYENHFKIIDLYPVFNNEKNSLYIEHNIHWNGYGQFIGAKTTYDFLKNST